MVILAGFPGRPWHPAPVPTRTPDMTPRRRVDMPKDPKSRNLKAEGTAMSKNSSRTAGRHFLQIPGPTPVPDRILCAMDMPVIDHRGPEVGKLGRRALEGIKTIFKCAGPVIIYPASGTCAWEVALATTLPHGV